MSGRIHRQMRRQALRQAADHARLIVPAIKATADNAEAALKNEEVTRERVIRLESVVGRGFGGRFKWLLLGR